MRNAFHRSPGVRLKSLAMVESVRQSEEEFSSEKRHYISSLAPELAQAMRSHGRLKIACTGA